MDSKASKDKQQQSILSPDQQELLDQWYAHFDESQKDLVIFENPQQEERIYSSLLRSIYAAIPQSTAPDDKLVPSPVTTFNLFQHRWFSAAAIFMLCAICIAVYKHHFPSADSTTKPQEVFTQVTTGTGKMMEVTLSDGSVVTLNASTKLSYPKHFSAGKREVYLEGEAFFKVVHQVEKPFIVHSGDLNTQVLGTSFNIRAYKGIDEIKINVATGKVGVSNASKTLGLLLPNQQINYHQKAQSYVIEEKNAAIANSWRMGKIRLDGVSFNELAIVIRNTYGYTLETSNPEIRKTSFTTTFNSYDKIEAVMHAISRVPDAEFRIIKQKISMY